MIETFGCDYSTSGMTLQGLHAKLRVFLESTTADGPRHDTYVVFYSGHTHYNGDWALAGVCIRVKARVILDMGQARETQLVIGSK